MTNKHDTPAVRISARTDGFRRAGVAHSAAPIDYDAGWFSPAQLEALRGEAMLIVQDVEAKPAKAGKGKDAGEPKPS
jgi:hypothetical protein